MGQEGREEAGTASVELVAALPFLLLSVIVAAQLGLAGHALWSAAIAARAGARADLVDSDQEAVARRALPAAMRRGSRVDSRGEAVTVRVPVPRIVPGLPAIGVSASSSLGSGGG